MRSMVLSNGSGLPRETKRVGEREALEQFEFGLSVGARVGQDWQPRFRCQEGVASSCFSLLPSFALSVF